MEQLIRHSDFVNATDQDQNKFNDASDRMDDLGKKEIRGILIALKEVLSTIEFPHEVDPGTYMVIYPIRNVLDTMSEDDKMHDLYSEVFDIFITCLEHGPTTGHLEVMDTIANSLSLKELSEEFLTSQQLGKLLRTLQRNWIPHNCEHEISTYLSRLDTRLQHIVYDEIIPEKLEPLQSQAVEFVRLFAHCQNQAANQPEENAEDYINLFYKLIDYKISKLKELDTRLYMILSDSDCNLIKEHIDIIGAIIERDDFPLDDYSKDLIEMWLKELMIPLKNKPQVGRIYYTNFLQLREKMLGSKNQTARDLGSELVSYWKDIHKSLLKENQMSLQDEVTVMMTMIDTWEPDATSREEIERRLTEDMLPKFKNKTEAGIILDVVIKLLKSQQTDYAKFVPEIFQHNPKLIVWKEHTERAVQIYEALHEFAQKVVDDEEEMEARTTVSEEVSERLAELLRTAKVNKQITPVIFEILLEALKRTTEALVECASESLELIDFKAVKDRAAEPMEIVLENLKTGKMNESEDYVFKSVNSQSVALCIEQISGSELPESYKDVMQRITNAVPELDLEDEYGTNLWIIHSLTYIRLNAADSSCIDKSIASILQICKDPSEDQSMMARSLLTRELKPHHHLLKNFGEQLVELYLKLYQWESLDYLADMYPQCADVVHKHLGKMLDKLVDTDNPLYMMYLAALLLKVATENPQVIHKDHMQFFSSHFKTSSPHLLPVYLQLAKNRLDLMEDEVNFLLEFLKENNSQLPSMRDVMVTLGLGAEQIAEKITLFLVKLLQSNSTGNKLVILLIIQSLGVKYEMLLPPHTDVFKSLQVDAQLKPTCTSLLDTIEGRSLATLSIQVTQQQEELDDVKDDVAATGEDVEQLEQRVTAHDEDIDHIKEDVIKAEDRLDAVEETVEETAEKVEELDHKTMSNAPAWSRDVSRLLNPEAAHDWRLLGQRLGYTNDDIRGWATQNDPCMSLLSEWFATHRTSEATHGVLKALEEMNRTDAAEIVQQALDAVGDVVEDEEEMTGPLPPIFLSYEWGRQAEVLLLRRHLEMAGFRCWMDLGQMGGGDKLYSKIDAGMRASKVMICCVTEKYAKSDNCNREVNLAVTLGKPILPLLMTQMSWPPAGAMGPIFGEYLFIRMFQRPHERTDDTRYWPQPKFQELLMQLRYHIVPDEDLVKEEYENWWEPKEEVIVIPKDHSDGGAPATIPMMDTGEETTESCPQVFLSYQWGKQPQVKALYRRLTQLGYTCWIDINQMGGGDSLYDKIDRGIRGCHVVLPCVTSKYTMSANCRRELSLADAIKKPIIPLLLESIVWPPPGPMSMVFTQLMYIGFQRDPDIQKTWTGPQFDELVAKLRHFIPRGGDVLDTEADKCFKQVDVKQTDADSTKMESDSKQIYKNGKELETQGSATNADHDSPQPAASNSNGEQIPRTKPSPQSNVSHNQPPIAGSDKSACCRLL